MELVEVFDMSIQTQNCPWCGSAISSEKFLEITAKIREEERRRLAETEATLRKQLSGEKQVAEQRAAQQIAAATAERDSAVQKLKDVEARESAVMEQAREEASRQAQETNDRELQKQRATFEAQLAATRKSLADAEAREAAIRVEARDQALRDVENTLEAERNKHRQLYEQKAALEAEKDAALRRLADTEAREAAIRSESEAHLKTVLDQAEHQRQKEIGEIRSILEADRDQSVLKKQVEFTREREKWQKEILDLQHKVQNKTADEIGEGAEVDLFEILKAEFETDSLSRVKKGQPGADIRHEIRHNGEICGTIVYDSKNRQGWQLGYATKLRQDQLDAQADHALLATTAFPSGKKELCIESDVIVVNPARAIPIVHLLRRALISMHVRGLSLKARTEKTEQLYAFINSSAYQQQFEQIGGLTNDALELDVEEKKAHDLLWKRRGTILKRQSALLRELDTEITAIIEGTEASRKPAA
jgi:hypothetical protein